MPNQNHYELLGVLRDANDVTIKKSFRRLALEWHPDRNKSPNATQRMQEINAAYDILKDPLKRAVYDRSLRPRADTSSTSGYSSQNRQQASSERKKTTASEEKDRIREEKARNKRLRIADILRTHRDIRSNSGGFTKEEMTNARSIRDQSMYVTFGESNKQIVRQAEYYKNLWQGHVDLDTSKVEIFDAEGYKRIRHLQSLVYAYDELSKDVRSGNLTNPIKERNWEWGPYQSQ